MKRFLVAAVTGAVLVCGAVRAQTLPPGFTESRIAANGTTIHVVKGGKGPAVLLLHGWPQSWYAWRKVIPLLAKDHTVVAADLRGIGGSDTPASGYDTPTLAEDMHGVITALALKNITLVGHDIGGMVAYAYVRTHSADLARAVILEATIPGLGEWEMQKNSARAWHMNFHQQTGLTEMLVNGHQEEYLKYFYKRSNAYPDAITDADLKVFAQAYGTPEHLKAGFEFYRAFPRDEAFAHDTKDKLPLPVLILSGEASNRRARDEAGATDMRAHGMTNISVDVIAGAGHYVADQQPEVLVARLRRFIAGK